MEIRSENMTNGEGEGRGVGGVNKRDRKETHGHLLTSSPLALAFSTASVSG